MKTKLIKFASEYFLFVSVVGFVLMFINGDFTGWARCIGQIMLAFAIGCNLNYKHIGERLLYLLIAMITYLGLAVTIGTLDYIFHIT